MNARRKSASADPVPRARRTGPSYGPSVYGSTPDIPDEHEIPFPLAGDVWISDEYVCVTAVPADEWPEWTDLVAFGASSVGGAGHV